MSCHSVVMVTVSTLRGVERQTKGDKMIKLIIPMKIFPKPRPRMGKYGNFYTPRDKREDNLESYIEEFIIKNKLLMFTTNLRVDCIYYCKGLAPCDKDNADKTIGDCGEGLLWRNDRQIKDSRTRFIENADKDSIEIEIKEIK